MQKKKNTVKSEFLQPWGADCLAELKTSQHPFQSVCLGGVIMNFQAGFKVVHKDRKQG